MLSTELMLSIVHYHTGIKIKDNSFSMSHTVYKYIVRAIQQKSRT